MKKSHQLAAAHRSRPAVLPSCLATHRAGAGPAADLCFQPAATAALSSSLRGLRPDFGPADHLHRRSGVGSLRAGRCKASFRANDALDRLLTGTGLVVEYSASGAIMIRRERAPPRRVRP